MREKSEDEKISRYIIEQLNFERRLYYFQQIIVDYWISITVNIFN